LFDKEGIVSEKSIKNEELKTLIASELWKKEVEKKEKKEKK
jgi:stalled ribosome alternative rescue factor ArfA